MLDLNSFEHWGGRLGVAFLLHMYSPTCHGSNRWFRFSSRAPNYLQLIGEVTCQVPSLLLRQGIFLCWNSTLGALWWIHFWCCSTCFAGSHDSPGAEG